MSTSPDAWKLPAGTDACARCGRTLSPGELITACIRFTAEGAHREDRCETCGRTVEDGDVVFWRARRHDEADRRPVVDYELLREIFETLRTRTDVTSTRLAYLVGLVLVRKKVLRLDTFEVRGGREVMVVRRKRGGEPLEVPAPPMSAENMVEVRDQLGRLLRADLSDLEGLADRSTVED